MTTQTQLPLPPANLATPGGGTPLLESGAVAFDAGFDPHGALPLDDQLKSVYGAQTIEALEKLGAQLVSVNPPMWVVDDAPVARGFVEFAEAEAAAAPPGAFDEIVNPGSYVLQERLPLSKAAPAALGATAPTGGADAAPFTPRAELDGINGLLKTLTSSAATFLDDLDDSKTVAVKRYTLHASHKLGEVGDTRALERLHIDRNRDEGSPKYRQPMRLTLLLSYDDLGGTHFPFATPLEGREMPQGVTAYDGGEMRVDERSLLPATTKAAGGDASHWPYMPHAGKAKRGMYVGGKRGRMLVFASSAADATVPLYASLHQGALGRQGAAAADEEAAAEVRRRRVTVIGWDGARYETSCRHECLDHEDFETRAGFFGRTIEQEVVGVMLTGGDRAGEARAYADRLAAQRSETLARLVSQELENESARGSLQATEALRDLNLTPSASEDTDAVLSVWRRAQNNVVGAVSALRHGQAGWQDRHAPNMTPREGPLLSRGQTYENPPEAGSLPQLRGGEERGVFWAPTCTVCQGDFLEWPSIEVTRDVIEPGFLSCGHLMCETCFVAMSGHHQLVVSGRVRCPTCRNPSAHRWQPLLLPVTEQRPTREWCELPQDVKDTISKSC